MSAGMTASKVGQALGVSADTVRRHHAAWTARDGFPRPLFDAGMLRWDEALVTAWKLRRSQAASTPAEDLEPDYAAIARRRGAALDAGLNPDL